MVKIRYQDHPSNCKFTTPGKLFTHVQHCLVAAKWQ